METKVSLKEFKRQEAEFAKDLSPANGFQIRPVRILKTNARVATIMMNLVDSGRMREKDASLVMIPWLRAAIDAARDYMSTNRIREITRMSEDDFRRFMFSANALVHACSYDTLRRAYPPRNVDCSVSEWTDYLIEFNSKSFVPVFVPKDPVVIYDALMGLTDAIIGNSWISDMREDVSLDDRFPDLF